MDTTSVVESILEHHGVRGMKWGVRRKATVGPQEVVISDQRKKIKTSGGKGFPAHSDAIKARTLGQRGKGSGLKSLSNKELQDYAQRLQLEQNVKRLNYNERSRGRQFVDKFLGREGARLANNAAQTGGAMAGRAALGYAAKKSVKVAAVAALA